MSAAHGFKVAAGEGKELGNQLLGILDHADRAQGIGAQVGSDEQGLGIRVGNASDAG